ncbi:MAG: DUF4111 domain-containing protein [Oscillospiraceae bacterium]|nr:DUF4111 domain-containing protein [Oscillospiraceae bacterium]
MTPGELLARIKESYATILGPKLTGIYVHGSLAFGCFRWEVSDIDFLAVVTEPLTQAEKERLISSLLELDIYAPPKGFEMSVVLEAVCNPFVYPTPFELHFSNAHKARCRENLSEYCRTMNGTDKDLAAHVTVIRHVGRTLLGKPIEEVFAEIPKAAYWDSIRGDVQEAEEEIAEQPVYYILNLCRVLAFLKDGLVLSKSQGGQWGMEHCPEYRELIGNALTAYEGTTAFRAEETALRDFAVTMLEEINKHT